MTLPARRSLLIAAVLVSLLLGVVSIRIASHLSALSAAPTAPPVSLVSLSRDLAVERARAADLEQQLADLLSATGALTIALDSTSDQVSADGLTADQLRERLKAAQAKLASVTALLAEAEARLAAAQAAAGSGGSGAGAGGAAATPAPAGTATNPTLSLALSGGSVHASWTSCPAGGFTSAALVRSTDPEIHYPPEDHDTLIANVTSLGVTAATDQSPPAGTLTYRLYCLTAQDGGTHLSVSSASKSIAVP